jgi:competence ComEA-like helix-hairpin-helix protein
MQTSLSPKGVGNYNQPQGGKATMEASQVWRRLYIALLAVLLVACVSGGIVFLLKRASSPGLDVLIPTPVSSIEATPVPPTPGARVNINTATAAELTKLPNIGEVKANAIVSYRESKGPFVTPDEIMNVPGIGLATYEKLRDLITVGPS